jgi:hypothetical protein
MKRAAFAIALVLMALTIPMLAQSACNQTFVTESLPGFYIGTPAHFQIEVCCGTAPYRFEIIQGTLPAGLHLNKNGKITGVPREEADTVVFVQLRDAAGCTLTQAFAVRVMP